MLHSANGYCTFDAISARWYRFLTFLALDFSGFGGLSGGIGHKLRQPFVDRPRLFRSARSRPPSRTIIPPQDWAHRLVRPEYPRTAARQSAKVGSGFLYHAAPRTGSLLV